MCWDYHFSPNAAFTQAEPLCTDLESKTFWLVLHSKAINANQAVRCGRFDAIIEIPVILLPSPGSQPPRSLSSSDSAHPFTFIIRVSTSATNGFSDSFAQSHRCWESDLCLIKSPASPEPPDNEVLLLSCLCCVGLSCGGCEQRHQTKSLHFRRTVLFDSSLSLTTVIQIPVILRQRSSSTHKNTVLLERLQQQPSFKASVGSSF